MALFFMIKCMSWSLADGETGGLIKGAFFCVAAENFPDCCLFPLLFLTYFSRQLSHSKYHELPAEKRTENVTFSTNF